MYRPLEARTGYYIILMSDSPRRSRLMRPSPKSSSRFERPHANEVMKATMAKYKIQVEDNDFFDAGGKPAQPGQRARQRHGRRNLRVKLRATRRAETSGRRTPARRLGCRNRAGTPAPGEFCPD